ncbi:hypothetical protein FRB93_001960 [Tulasnella sp. JGI-2019a]|nr:hypothetical protein FRB93_001960 [Tulasnella sp. JGI-2019a]
MFGKITVLTLATSVILVQSAPYYRNFYWDLGSAGVDDSTSYSGTGTALYGSTVSASDNQRNAQGQSSFSATCWSTGGLTCAVYTLTNPNRNSNGFFTEYTIKDGSWQKPTSVSSSTVSILMNTPMVAVNTHDFGRKETAVFFISKDNKLSYFDRVDGAAGFTLSSQNLPITGSVQYMTAATWRNTNSNPAYSIWYSDQNGNVYSWRYDKTGKWNFDDQQIGITVSGSFVVSIQSDHLMTDLYSPIGHHWKRIGAAGSPWTSQGDFSIQDHGHSFSGISGGILPWDITQAKFYFSGKQSQGLVEGSIGVNSTNLNIDHTFNINPTVGTNTVTSMYGSNIINIFTMTAQGIVSIVSTDGGNN